MPYTVERFTVFVHLSLIGTVNSAVAVFSRFNIYTLHSQLFPNIPIFNNSTVMQSHTSHSTELLTARICADCLTVQNRIPYSKVGSFPDL